MKKKSGSGNKNIKSISNAPVATNAKTSLNATVANSNRSRKPSRLSPTNSARIGDRSQSSRRKSSAGLETVSDNSSLKSGAEEDELEGEGSSSDGGDGKPDQESDESTKKSMVRQSSLDRLMAKVISLKTLYPKIVAETAKAPENNLDERILKAFENHLDKDDKDDRVSTEAGQELAFDPHDFLKQISSEVNEIIVMEPKENTSEDDISPESQMKNETADEGNVKVNAIDKDEEEVEQEVVTTRNEAKKTSSDIASLGAICDAFSSGMKVGKTLKEVAKFQMVENEDSILDRMMASSKTVAVGRREFDEEEIKEESDEESEEDEEDIKTKIKNAKPKYLQMFEKQEPETQPKQQIDTNPKNYGLWDSVSDVRVLPTLLKVKREWHPPDWEKILQTIRAEGRDVASIDADLKEISHSNRETTVKKTGKYLMPEDLAWCRKHARFGERDLLKWFKRFRTNSSNGEMMEPEFCKLFNIYFPFSDPSIVSEIVYRIFVINDNTGEKKGLDFKDFILVMDSVACKSCTEKVRWATSICTRKCKDKGHVDMGQLKEILTLVDQVEVNGYMDAPTQDDLDELAYRRKMEPLKLIEDRSTDIFRRFEVNLDGLIDVQELFKMPQSVIYARE